MKLRLSRSLQELGLSEKESLVYLAALELGPSTPLRLASESGVKRATVYTILESLKEKGLMFLQYHGEKKRFAAESPEKLEVLLEQRRTLLKNILPDLNTLRVEDASEGRITQFQGLASMRQVYEGLLRDVRPGDDYLIISHQAGIFELDPVFFQKFVERRAKLDIRIRMLTTDTPLGRKHAQEGNLYNMEVRLLPETKVLQTNLVIIPRRVVIHQLNKPVLLLVAENQSFIQLHRELFEIIWKTGSYPQEKRRIESKERR